MKVISIEQDFRPIELSIESIVDKEKFLPEMVFRPPFNHFLFISQSDLFVPNYFLKHLKQYLINSHEKNFWVTALEPSPRLYYKKNFDIFGAFEFSTLDTDADYLSAFNHYPKESNADALAYRGDTLLVSSFSKKWAVYANREDEIAICAFSNSTQMELFKEAYGDDLLDGVEHAAEFAYRQYADITNIPKLCANYS